MPVAWQTCRYLRSSPFCRDPPTYFRHTLWGSTLIHYTLDLKQDCSTSLTLPQAFWLARSVGWLEDVPNHDASLGDTRWSKQMTIPPNKLLWLLGSHIVFRDFTSNLGAYMNDPSVIWSFCFCFSHHFGNRLHIPLSSYICTLGLDCMIAVFRAQIIFHFLHVEMSKIIGEVCVSKSVEIWMEVVRLIWVIVGNHKKFESDEK
jgi:hypothetical protein